MSDEIKIEKSPDEQRLASLGVKSWPIWTKEQSEFPWHYDDTETCYFLEGEVEVTPAGGESQILVLDSDLLILKSCPNLFEIVHAGTVGTIYEDVGSRQADRRSRIKKVQTAFGDVGWTEGYINTGVAIFSKEHKELFKHDSNTKLWLDLGYDDVFLGWRIHKMGIPVFTLDFTFNHMSMFSEEWNGFANRADSHIVHYAGNGFYFNVDKVEQIKQDKLTFKRYGLL